MTQGEDGHRPRKVLGLLSTPVSINPVALLLLIGAASVAVRILSHYEFESTALLYIGLPYLIALAIAVLRPEKSTRRWWHEYRDGLLSALVVMLGSSIVLFEGFVCVLFFLPIYLFVFTFVFLARWYIVWRERNRSTSGGSVLPLLFVVLSLEGTTPTLTVDRDNSVSAVKTTVLSRVQVLRNLAKPIDLKTDRHWMLSIFPMPHEIVAGSLNVGDIHRVRTRYRRWFFANTHEGEMRLEIAEVSPNRVRTRIIEDSTFFATYLETKGTEITLTPTAEGTRIALRIDYRRKLDPSWYFQPLQQYAVGQMAEFLIDEVMIRE